MLHRVKSVLLLFFLTIFSSFLSAEVLYQLIDLGGLEGYPITLVRDLNDRGDAAGSALLPAEDKAHAVLFDETGARDLGAFTGRMSLARGVNNQGIVVGRSVPEYEGPAMSAFVWTREAGMACLRGLGGCFSSASAINEDGVIVGVSDLDNGSRHAVMWEKGKPVRDLLTLGGEYSNAADINDQKLVVGRSGLKNGESHAFLWTEETGMIDLGALDSHLSGARGLNNRGDVVGYVGDVDDKVGAFIWDKESGMRRLGYLLEGDFTIANSVNEKRQAVGIAFAKGWHRAFIWDEHNGLRDLNALIDPCLKWRLHYAVAINNLGQIAGVGQKGGHYRSFLLVPLER